MKINTIRLLEVEDFEITECEINRIHNECLRVAGADGRNDVPQMKSWEALRHWTYSDTLFRLGYYKNLSNKTYNTLLKYRAYLILSNLKPE